MSRAIGLLLLGALTTACVASQENDGSDEAMLGATSRPTLSAVHADVPPVLDGVMDDVWRSAPESRFATDWSGKATPFPTTVRSLWSEHALYMLFTVENTALSSDLTRPITVEREGLYKEDCVELFFTPSPAEPKKYFEIELGPHGHFFDLAIDRKAGTSDVDWSSGAALRTAVDAAAHTAVIEVALTSPDIVRALKRGAKLPIGMFRMEGRGARQYLAWSPTRTPRPNFHVPEAFGTLALE